MLNRLYFRYISGELSRQVQACKSSVVGSARIQYLCGECSGLPLTNKNHESHAECIEIKWPECAPGVEIIELALSCMRLWKVCLGSHSFLLENPKCKTSEIVLPGTLPFSCTVTANYWDWSWNDIALHLLALVLYWSSRGSHLLEHVLHRCLMAVCAVCTLVSWCQQRGVTHSLWEYPLSKIMEISACWPSVVPWCTHPVVL